MDKFNQGYELLPDRSPTSDVSEQATQIREMASSMFAPGTASGSGLGRGGEISVKRSQSVPKKSQAGTLSAGSGETVSATRGRPKLTEEEIETRAIAKAKGKNK
eukprot:4343037-Heterocapsa_arctica.AAC.1